MRYSTTVIVECEGIRKERDILIHYSMSEYRDKPIFHAVFEVFKVFGKPDVLRKADWFWDSIPQKSIEKIEQILIGLAARVPYSAAVKVEEFPHAS